MPAARHYNSFVTNFSTVKEAKDFLANRIVAEAKHENVPLSEVERKMLYWSETDWTLPDMMEVGAEFDRDYDQDEHEQKIAKLVANITAHHHQNNEEEKWDAAVDKLSEGDHYLTVLIGEADRSGGLLSILDNQPIRTPRDFLMALLAAFALIFSIFALFALSHWLSGTKLWHGMVSAISDPHLFFVGVLILAAAYFLATRLWRVIRFRSHRS